MSGAVVALKHGDWTMTERQEVKLRMLLSLDGGTSVPEAARRCRAPATAVLDELALMVQAGEVVFVASSDGAIRYGAAA